MVYFLGVYIIKAFGKRIVDGGKIDLDSILSIRASSCKRKNSCLAMASRRKASLILCDSEIVFMNRRKIIHILYLSYDKHNI